MDEEDFVVEAVRGSDSDERKRRAKEFTHNFSQGFKGVLEDQSDVGFRVVDVGKKQPDSRSCLIAVVVAAARGMNTTNEKFDTSVTHLYEKALEARIVDQTGIHQIYRDEITAICSEVDLLPEFVRFYPNDMSGEESLNLGEDVAENLREGNGIAMLIPSYNHWVLLHGTKKGKIKVFNTLNGSDSSWPVGKVANNMGHIVGGEMQGERYSGNGYVVLKPIDKDFKMDRTY